MSWLNCNIRCNQLWPQGLKKDEGRLLKLEAYKELIGFQEHLREMEKSRHTIEKYSRDVRVP